jgi:hypothetical protein
MTSEKLIGLDILTEIVETAIFSAHLTDTIPISLILIGQSGSGKSKLIIAYNSTIGCHLTNDVTSMGLSDLMSADIAGKIRFLIVPDFNLVLSHRSSTTTLTVANLLSLLSEGTVRVDDGRIKKEVQHIPVGILTAMTRDLYSLYARKWAILGLNRRFIPIYYEYSLETRMKIQDSIAAGKTTLLQLNGKKLALPSAPTDVDLAEYVSQLKAASDELATNIGWIPAYHRIKPKNSAAFSGKALEFSPHLALRSMARAHALREKRKEVTPTDVAFIMKLLQFTRYDRPGVL